MCHWGLSPVTQQAWLPRAAQVEEAGPGCGNPIPPSGGVRGPEPSLPQTGSSWPGDGLLPRTEVTSWPRCPAGGHGSKVTLQVWGAGKGEGRLLDPRLWPSPDRTAELGSRVSPASSPSGPGGLLLGAAWPGRQVSRLALCVPERETALSGGDVVSGGAGQKGVPLPPRAGGWSGCWGRGWTSIRSTCLLATGAGEARVPPAWGSGLASSIIPTNSPRHLLGFRRWGARLEGPQGPQWGEALGISWAVSAVVLGASGDQEHACAIWLASQVGILTHRGGQRLGTWLPRLRPLAGGWWLQPSPSELTSFLSGWAPY